MILFSLFLRISLKEENEENYSEKIIDLNNCSDINVLKIEKIHILDNVITNNENVEELFCLLNNVMKKNCSIIGNNQTVVISKELRIDEISMDHSVISISNLFFSFKKTFLFNISFSLVQLCNITTNGVSPTFISVFSNISWHNSLFSSFLINDTPLFDLKNSNIKLSSSTFIALTQSPKSSISLFNINLSHLHSIETNFISNFFVHEMILLFESTAHFSKCLFSKNGGPSSIITLRDSSIRINSSHFIDNSCQILLSHNSTMIFNQLSCERNCSPDPILSFFDNSFMKMSQSNFSNNGCGSLIFSKDSNFEISSVFIIGFLSSKTMIALEKSLMEINNCQLINISTSYSPNLYLFSSKCNIDNTVIRNCFSREIGVVLRTVYSMTNINNTLMENTNLKAGQSSVYMESCLSDSRLENSRFYSSNISDGSTLVLNNCTMLVSHCEFNRVIDIEIPYNPQMRVNMCKFPSKIIHNTNIDTKPLNFWPYAFVSVLLFSLVIMCGKRSLFFHRKLCPKLHE